MEVQRRAPRRRRCRARSGVGPRADASSRRDARAGPRSRRPGCMSRLHASSPGSLIPLSREVKIAAIFSTTVSCPRSTSSVRARARRNPRRSTSSGSTARRVAVAEQPGAGRLRDPDVRLVRLDVEADQLVVLPVGARAASRCCLGERRRTARRRRCVTVPSSALRTSSRPDQFSATSVVSRAAEVGIAHAHEAALGDRDDAAVGVAQTRVPGQRAAEHVELEVGGRALRTTCRRTIRRPRPGTSSGNQFGTLTRLSSATAPPGDLGHEPVVDPRRRRCRDSGTPSAVASGAAPRVTK